ncbi:UDP-N-acetyl-D-mannosaminuronic acid dehydrogenase [Burkholderia territorii]|uniref:NDP-N-acetyl-D-galactosaminuronic acid dehydrogenase n=1 Tax=Burkholderia territorii TaxID=1503055 RepID=A0A105VH47_9BURK|nr:UDP-N-acetyl-D-mannosamine dehydrogenase [Burkholderia territorii]KVV47668.1 UDP-N-acetyl-D-mannosaminuronic acid dehydrogenase [Burkholderia territorii]KVX29862.1 UDP-N-acetyl-D-mannosaminuronic acid dehydrogenase [Burkholderia territorii]
MKNTIQSISVVGLGYIGLPTAAVLASRKIKVIGVDIDQHAVDTINRGEIHIVEPELDIVVHAAVKEGWLRATTRPEPADAFMIAVPTPFHGAFEPDLSYVKAASESIAPVLKKGDIVILESTSPVGTTEQMVDWLARARPDLVFPVKDGGECDVYVAYCPERVLPGQVIRELIENDRVIGGVNPLSAVHAQEVYRTFVSGQLLVTDARTAEMSKLTENAFRDVNIAFANELSLICDKLDINVWELIDIANHHPRVSILQPGPGVGGHCIAVDPWFIVNRTPDQARLIRQAREVNDSKPHWVIDKVRAAVDSLCEAGKSRHDVRIACFGLAFKPNIDDLRESPSLDIAHKLADAYPEQVIVVEPHIDSIPEKLELRGARLMDLDGALARADVLVMLVDHAHFKVLKPELRETQRLVDTKGIWD